MGNLVSIQDKSTNNALFNGVLKYCLTKDFEISGSNVVKEANKTAQQTYTAADGTTNNSKFKNAYNRKKSEVQYTAFTSPNIKFDILFKFDEKEIETRVINGTTVSMLNLGELMHIINTPKTFYLIEESVQSQLAESEYPYYSDYGIPIVIKTWSMTVEPNKDVIVSLTCVEDVDEHLGE